MIFLGIHTTWIRKAERWLFVILLALVFSCKKEPDCIECTTTFDVTYRYMDTFEKFSTSDTKEFCNMTKDEIPGYETANTGTRTEESSGVTTITVKTTKCTI